MLHEHQAKALLRTTACRSPGVAILAADEAEAAAKSLPGPLYVVKSQIHAGGRGKGRFKELGPDAKGGVRLAKSPAEVEANAREMLGNTLVTKQTGAAGRVVNRLYIEDGADIARELYCSLLVDRGTGEVAFVVSTEGGMDIETVAHDTPERIVTVDIDPRARASRNADVTKIVAALAARGTGGRRCRDGVSGALQGLHRKGHEPARGQSADRHEGRSSAAARRQGRLRQQRAVPPSRARGAARSRRGRPQGNRGAASSTSPMSRSSGNIGCMVNGAGLAMATMDIIKLYGEEPANFLDVGGGASREKVTAAFKIITADPNVKGILINIFGGIMRCDVIAEGVVAAVKEVGLKVPLVVRLEGTNVKEGKAILANSGLNVIPADDLDDAAKKIVAAIKAH